MNVEAVAVDGFEGYLEDDRYSGNGYLKNICERIDTVSSNQKVWLSKQATRLCPHKHFAGYAVIDRTKDIKDPQRIVCFLCEYHGCPYQALTYQAKALLPNQYILALIYLKDELKKQ